MWDSYVAQLSDEQFTQPSSYSGGSVRDQIIHLASTDQAWFSGLRGVELEAQPNPADLVTRENIRTYWDGVEKMMREYLAALRDEMLTEKPFPEGEDKDLTLWQVLLHVANHGTDHRAQLLRALRFWNQDDIPRLYFLRL